MKKLSDLLDEAYRKGYEYLARWRACAPTVFAAVMDTLGYAGEKIVDEVWKATIGLSGGTGNMTLGTCGAMAGAAMAISFSFGFTRENVEKNVAKVLVVSRAVAEVGEKMREKYGGIRCVDVQFHNWGKAYILSNPKSLAEFLTLAKNGKAIPECQNVTGDLARWAVESVAKFNPKFVRRSDVIL
ncbi:MAG: C-GCAxxG-C-C family (seleno)protein [Candidatus Jordarchaeales archaeon]